jgi:hypothetical protein
MVLEKLARVGSLAEGGHRRINVRLLDQLSEPVFERLRKTDDIAAVKARRGLRLLTAR